MPYFFVDGYRGGKPAQALYVKAENADAALVRASQLGMEGTGVRPAKDITASEPQSPKSFAIEMIFIATMVFVSGAGSFSMSSPQPNALSLFAPFMLIGSMISRHYLFSHSQYKQQQLMQADILSLQAAINQLQISQTEHAEHT